MIHYQTLILFSIIILQFSIFSSYADEKQSRWTRKIGEISSPTQVEQKFEILLKQINDQHNNREDTKSVDKLHQLLSRFLPLPSEYNWVYVERTLEIFQTVRNEYVEIPSVRSDLIQIALKALEQDFVPENIKEKDTYSFSFYCTSLQLDILLNFLSAYEFHHNPKPLTGSLTTVFLPELRKKRTVLILQKWQNIARYIDQTWMPENNTEEKLRPYFAGYIGLKVINESELAVQNIMDKTEREKIRKEISNKKHEEYELEFKRLLDRRTKDQEQIYLRELKSKYEPSVITFIAKLYAIEPQNSIELIELLKEYKIDDQFSQSVFEELKKRMAKSEN
ncbi:MAG: hypothetical protein LBC20_15270 [Planctomycetaceae bacterium]|jgi:hypothetical protein|nr:hypothetical protein [Planctomycetaceae bacterium]